MRTTILVALSLASCTPALTAVPDTGAPTRAAALGAQLTLLDEPWRGEPHDLPAHLLPLAVELRNAGPGAIDVSLGDFVIIDDNGAQVHACLLDQVLGEEAPQPPPARGPLLATVGPPANADPDREITLRGATAPPPTTDAERLALPQGPLQPGGRQRGFLFFQLEDLARPRPLRLRWRAHQTGSATVVGEVELRLHLDRNKR
jgi:hypothetical protein